MFSNFDRYIHFFHYAQFSLFSDGSSPHYNSLLTDIVYIYIHTHISTPYLSFSSNILISNILGHIFWFDPIHQNPPSYLLINDGFSCYDEVRRRTQALSDQRLIFHQMLTEEQID